MNPSYREGDPYKALYKAMDTEGSKTSFVLLARYPGRVATAQVLLTEAVCALLFGSLRAKLYWELRLLELPVVEWSNGLNRSAPLGASSSPQIGTDATTYRRLRTLDNCLRSGPVRVNVRKWNCRFYLFGQRFGIPVSISRAWDLENDRVIYVK